MRLVDKDHFRCPDCSTLLPRQMFSSHPAECTNKYEPKQEIRKEGTLINSVSEQPGEEIDATVNSFENYKLEISQIVNNVRPNGLIQKQSVINISENQVVTKKDSTFIQEVVYSCQYCVFHSPYKTALKLHKRIKHYLKVNQGLSERKHNLPTNHRPETDISFGRVVHPSASDDPNRHTNSLICSVCGAAFNYQISLRRHTEVKHSDVINFPCDECGKLFPRRCRKCSQHFSRTCNLCSKIFPCRNTLKDHLNIHSGFKPYQCNEHSITFYSKKRLQAHIHRRHEVSDKRKFESQPCAECNKMYSNKYGACVQHKGKDKTLPCDECKQLFVKKYDECSNHTKEKSLICEKSCGYKTSNKRHLKDHSLSSKCDPNKPFLREYRCILCKKGFSSEKNKQKHEKVHSDGKPHECNICFIQFTQRHALIKHLRKKHDIKLVWNTLKREYV